MKAGKSVPKSIDEYISRFSPDVQHTLEELRMAIRKAAPEAEEKISYQMPTFALKGNLVHFAAFKNHIGFYPVPSGIEAFRKELAPFIKGKGTVQFPLNEPVPYDLVKKIVIFRTRENLAKKKQAGRSAG